MTEYVTSAGETWQCPPWAIAPAARVTVRECSCGARIVWLKTGLGSLQPVDQDGLSHWTRCPQAPAWRTPRASREGTGL